MPATVAPLRSMRCPWPQQDHPHTTIGLPPHLRDGGSRDVARARRAEEDHRLAISSGFAMPPSGRRASASRRTSSSLRLRTRPPAARPSAMRSVSVVELGLYRGLARPAAADAGGHASCRAAELTKHLHGRGLALAGIQPRERGCALPTSVLCRAPRRSRSPQLCERRVEMAGLA
jgi:hypothetical protein